MATSKQAHAAKRNIRKAQRAAREKRTIAHLPQDTRCDLGKQAAAGRRRGGRAGHALEGRTRHQLYETPASSRSRDARRWGSGN